MVTSYETWIQTSEGQAALTQAKYLARYLLAPWPRRKQKFLDIGCGSGSMSAFLWSCGFDVTGLEKDPVLLAKAREELAPRIDFHLGQPGHLPFTDREFDYAGVFFALEDISDPEKVLFEAKRVVRKGIILSFFNKNSFYKRKTQIKSVKYSCSDIKKLMNKVFPEENSVAFSVFPFYGFFWENFFALSNKEAVILPSWIGFLSFIRIDFFPYTEKSKILCLKTESA